ncbi:hypothetical protein BGW80DRAFT_880561 [Lactifluus volemus]|nr:hypothetical protein BGW80DRAFT_880561 [Lactifluus volemus]
MSSTVNQVYTVFFFHWHRTFCFSVLLASSRQAAIYEWSEYKGPRHSLEHGKLHVYDIMIDRSRRMSDIFHQLDPMARKRARQRRQGSDLL